MARRERRIYQHGKNKKKQEKRRQWLIVCLVVFFLCWSEIERKKLPWRLSISFLFPSFFHLDSSCVPNSITIWQIATHIPRLFFFLTSIYLSCVDWCLSHYLWRRVSLALVRLNMTSVSVCFSFHCVHAVVVCCHHSSILPRLLVHFSLCGLFFFFVSLSISLCSFFLRNTFFIFFFFFCFRLLEIEDDDEPPRSRKQLFAILGPL